MIVGAISCHASCAAARYLTRGVGWLRCRLRARKMTQHIDAPLACAHVRLLFLKYRACKAECMLGHSYVWPRVWAAWVISGARLPGNPYVASPRKPMSLHLFLPSHAGSTTPGPNSTSIAACSGANRLIHECLKQCIAFMFYCQACPSELVCVYIPDMRVACIRAFMRH